MGVAHERQQHIRRPAHVPGAPGALRQPGPRCELGDDGGHLGAGDEGLLGGGGAVRGEGGDEGGVGLGGRGRGGGGEGVAPAEKGVGAELA